MATPSKDCPCLGAITQIVQALVFKLDRRWVALVAKHPATSALLDYLGSLASRDTARNAADGARSDTVVPCARLCLGASDPHDVDRVPRRLLAAQMDPAERGAWLAELAHVAVFEPVARARVHAPDAPTLPVGASSDVKR